MRAQLLLAIRLILLTVVILGSIPVTFLLVRSLGTISVFGLRLPWLLLGFAVYPFFVAVAWSYNRSADHNEREFTEMVQS
jgi:putative solute:sodium symporter small subunit